MKKTINYWIAGTIAGLWTTFLGLVYFLFWYLGRIFGDFLFSWYDLPNLAMIIICGIVSAMAAVYLFEEKLFTKA